MEYGTRAPLAITASEINHTKSSTKTRRSKIKCLWTNPHLLMLQAGPSFSQIIWVSRCTKWFSLHQVQKNLDGSQLHLMDEYYYVF